MRWIARNASALMSPSPIPMSICTVAIAVKPTGQATVPDHASCPGATDRSQHRRAPSRKRNRRHLAPRARQRRADHAINPVAASSAEDGHVKDVRPQREHPAVRKQEALHDQHRRQHHDRRAGPSSAATSTPPTRWPRSRRPPGN